jgi:hypothetical protein
MSRKKPPREPPVKCAYCGKTWNLANCEDVVDYHGTEVFPLTEFVGKLLRDVKKAYAARTDAIYFMQRDILIRNDRFIDLSPKYPDATKEWEKGIVKNERGWVDYKDGITDTYTIRAGDEGFFNVWRYYHSTCNRANLKEKETKAFTEVFQKAGFQSFTLTPIPNGYCPCDICAPWFTVSTDIGEITIGWRKRVINIDWEKVVKEGDEGRLLELFASENVTKGGGGIHAWGWDKAVEYLMILKDFVQNPSAPTSQPESLGTQEIQV